MGAKAAAVLLVLLAAVQDGACTAGAANAADPQRREAPRCAPAAAPTWSPAHRDARARRRVRQRLRRWQAKAVVNIAIVVLVYYGPYLLWTPFRRAAPPR